MPYTPPLYTYSISGMTCDHCVISIREEVAEIPGVTAVDVDLASGRLTVTGDNVRDGAVRAAVADTPGAAWAV